MKWGDAKKIKIVRQVFDWFAVQLKSLNWIAAELNRLKVPPRRGKVWYVATVKELLQRVEYRGAFSYNSRKSGNFHYVNGKKEVVPLPFAKEDRPNPYAHSTEGLFLKENVYKPIIDPKLFDKAQQRFEGFTLKGSRRPRADGYPLSGILVCGHCGEKMYGCLPTGRPYRVYRCGSNAKTGMGTCGTYEVHEEDILPIVLRELGKAIEEDLPGMLTDPPKALTHPRKGQDEKRRDLMEERLKLAAQIEKAEKNALLADDPRMFKSLQERVTVMRDELESLDQRLSTEPERVSGFTRDEVQALSAWWDEFQEKAVSVPVKGKMPVKAHFYQDPFSDEQAVLIDARIVNEALDKLGAKVELWWTTKTITTKAGKQQNRHKWVKGRLRLGEHNVTFRNSRTAASNSCNSAASRRDNRTDTDSRRR